MTETIAHETHCLRDSYAQLAKELSEATGNILDHPKIMEIFANCGKEFEKLRVSQDKKEQLEHEEEVARMKFIPIAANACVIYQCLQ